MNDLPANKFLKLPVLAALLFPVLFAGGCSKRQADDPMAGWTIGPKENLPPNAYADGTNFAAQLPDQEKQSLTIRYYSNQKGEKAIKMESPVNGAFKDHLLIYDVTGTRIKTVEYNSDHYSS